MIAELTAAIGRSIIETICSGTGFVCTVPLLPDQRFQFEEHVGNRSLENGVHFRLRGVGCCSGEDPPDS
ncbi:MAG: hypothetical protein AAEJ65_09230 [Planctomycetota bacterium]